MGQLKRLLQIATTRESEPAKQDLIQILHVVKQLISLVFGLIVGFLHLKGFPIILAFIVVSYVIGYIYCFKFLQIEEETMETMDVFKQSFMLSMMVFLLTWTLTYSFTL